VPVVAGTLLAPVCGAEVVLEFGLDAGIELGLEVGPTLAVWVSELPPPQLTKKRARNPIEILLACARALLFTRSMRFMDASC
jgi:hypothetical protein